MYVYIQEEMNRIANEKSAWAQQIVTQTRKFERLVISLIADMMHSGEMRSDVPVRIAANAIFGMLNWTHRWYQPGGPQTAEQVSNGFVNIFFEGMRTKT
jgi:hypothetical protein